MTINKDHIAVIGIGCRYPGVSSKEEYWNVISNGIDTKQEYSQDDLINAGLNENELNNKHVPLGYCIEDVDQFDADFFNLTARDAKILDPQIRIAYECVWRAFEDAGYSPYKLDGPVGVYASTVISDYYVNNILPNSSYAEPTNALSYLIANDKDYLASHLAYKFNFTGPCMAVQCACSSSLVAIDLACKSLQGYSSDYALAAGISIHFPQRLGYFVEEDSVYSSDGCCRPFDKNANGMLFGDGAGVVILKRLTDAIRDQDSIYAIIRASSVNNDGNNKVGYGALSKQSQADAIVTSLLLSEITSDTISYVETHGTGTSMGDPIEVAALTEAFRLHTNKNQFCAIGSVKPNFGHTEAASGITSFIKAVLALKNKKIPPSLNYSSPNPEIDFENSPFYVNTELTEWCDHSYPRRAGVSSFGIGGTNAHVILEEPPTREEPIIKDWPAYLVIGSAKSSVARDEYINKYHEYFDRLIEQAGQNDQIDSVNTLNNVAFTCALNRTHFEHRFAFVGNNFEQIFSDIKSNADGEPSSNVLVSDDERVKQLAYFFSSQEDQYIYLAKELYKYIPSFKQRSQELFDLLDERHIDLTSFFEGDYSSQENIERDSSLCKFILELAVVKWLQATGMRPDVLISNDIGAYTAACVADVLTAAEAIGLLELHIKFIQKNYAEAIMAEYSSRLNLIDMQEPCVKIEQVGAKKVIPIINQQYWLELLQNSLSERAISYNNIFKEYSFMEVNSNSNVMNGFLLFIAKLYVSGWNINWDIFYDKNQYKKCELPYYPWQRKSYWMTSHNQDTTESKALSSQLIAGLDKDELMDLLINKTNINIDQKYTSQEWIEYLLDACSNDEESAVKTSSAFTNQEAYISCIVKVVASLLEIPLESVDSEQSLIDIGVDSITAVLLKNSIKNEMNLDIPLVKFIQGLSISEIIESEDICNKNHANQTEPNLPFYSDIKEEDIDDMNEEELDLMIEMIGATDEY